MRIDLIVSCVRRTENSATLQSALQLLSTVSKQFQVRLDYGLGLVCFDTLFLLQEDVLLHVMSVFTFVGTGLLRKDDAYSYQVVRQTLETVVPALVKVIYF